jgi:hypothetical protein
MAIVAFYHSTMLENGVKIQRKKLDILTETGIKAVENIYKHDRFFRWIGSSDRETSRSVVFEAVNAGINLHNP